MFRFRPAYIHDISKRMYEEINNTFPPREQKHAKKGFDLATRYANTFEINPPLLYGGMIALIILLAWKLLLGLLAIVVIVVVACVFEINRRDAQRQLIALIASNRLYWEPLMAKVQRTLEKVIEECE